MADYCHDFDPGGLGCGRNCHEEKQEHEPCPKNCLGDFTSSALHESKELKRGEEVVLGICEGHGETVVLYLTMMASSGLITTTGSTGTATRSSGGSGIRR